ncbi:dephospho-CoA kinase [Herbaspirillum sp. RTI4]|uniref:dephospho-CoA kinase n=1 Tax=Herbaspirillum sp. RTI4 TaxID=3048640 RepID=UPI002AB59F99|nr:dephospho-CoA kinase [Herbaspirillum sp. RTI4]MDY7577495.1 dephospho-CoA kinase [Herbaspirillum sp. RTI4]MEA9980970.1 dephospho-CoA kinase [Herbaspirillum sp. RTI4]
MTSDAAISRTFSIGLTGGIGSGKTTIANLFGERGATLIDTDAIAHQLTAPGGAAIPAITAEFGPDFIDAAGALDRARMRAHVFSAPAARHRLESLLHPMIRAATAEAAARATGCYTIFVVPLLVESGTWKQRVDSVLVVDCSEATQIARVMQRSKLSADEVRAIMEVQATREQRLACADDVIDNDADHTAAGHAQLQAQIDALHARYLALAETKRHRHL